MVPGLLPVSYWTVSSIEPAQGPPTILADKIDPETGEVLSLVDSHTVFDGLLIEAFRVEAESGPALDGAGHTLRKVRHTDDQSLDELGARAKQAVKHMVDEGIAEIEKVIVERGTGTAEDTVGQEIWIKDRTITNETPEAKPFPIPRTKD